MVRKQAGKRGMKTISVDQEIWDTAKGILRDDLGMAISKYIELQLRALIRSRSGSYADFMQGTLEDTFHIMSNEVNKAKPKKKPK